MGSKGKGGRMRFQPPSMRGTGERSPEAMMKQAQQLQAQILQAQEELATEAVSASVAGAVTVVATGQGEVRSVKINPEALDPDSVEILEDAIAAAVNEALRKSRELADKKMEPFMGPLRMAGLM